MNHRTSVLLGLPLLLIVYGRSIHAQDDSLTSPSMCGVGDGLTLAEWIAAHPDDPAREDIQPCDLADTAPVRLSSPSLRYPAIAQQWGFEGDVVLEAVVEIDGSVRFLEVVDLWVSDRNRLDPLRKDAPPFLKSDVRDAFEDAARDLLAATLFIPATMDGAAVRTLVCLPVHFRLLPQGGLRPEGARRE